MCSFPWVDPAKEISAKEKEYDLLLTDPITELESRGIDPDEMLDRWTEWKNKIEKRKLNFMAKGPLVIDTTDTLINNEVDHANEY